ncbi:hypothetical protein [Thioalkalivibrio sp. ALJT]|uniref:DUF7489 domain-containing protein n=1 Tax=Thioalkalivibrio sp. ALJT TaxID=1158146 RepID=UPI000375F658|nr:hypothetical protein [Thioalkalivibrio sp. ALJT]
MEDMLGLLGGIGLAVVISIALMAYQKKKRNQAWAGAVTDIRQFEATEEDRPGKEYVRVRYRRDDGKKGKLTLERYQYQQMFPDLKVGDRLIKEVGQDHPRVESAATRRD